MISPSRRPVLTGLLGLLGLLSLVFAVQAGAAVSGPAAELIKHFGMQKIPDEGPWFVATYKSTDVLAAANLPARYKGEPHVFGGAIYCLETRDDFSAMHILRTDEMWHYYGGDPLELLLLHPDGRGETVVLGPDVLHGQQPQYVVPRGVWQGSRPIGASPDAYTFFGTTMAPGFEYPDFDIGYRDELQKAYPEFADRIAALTRTEFVTRPPQLAGAAATPLIAPPGPTVFTPADVKQIDVAPGIALHELAGREALAKSDAYSIALFNLAPGQGMPTSYNQVAEEVFLIASGVGEVTLDGKSTRVAAGATVVIKPKVRHSIKAARSKSLSFYAISVPAYSNEDYVLSH